VYAGYFAVVGVIYFLVGLASCCTDGVTRQDLSNIRKQKIYFGKLTFWNQKRPLAELILFGASILDYNKNSHDIREYV